MHWFRKCLKQTLAKIRRFEQEFLGPKNCFDKKLIFLTINEDDNYSLSHLIGFHAQNKTPILISAEPILGFVGLWLKPNSLEQVPLMIAEVKNLDPLLIIAHVSLLFSEDSNESFASSQVINLFKTFKKLHHDGIHMIIIEYEQSLGVKKSALLKRLMNTREF